MRTGFATGTGVSYSKAWANHRLIQYSGTRSSHTHGHCGISDRYLSLLMLVLLFSEVHPFGSATADPIAVDIVTSEEVAEQKQEPAVAPETKPAFDSPAQPAPSSCTGTGASPRPAGGSAVSAASASCRRDGSGAAAAAAANVARLRCSPSLIFPSNINVMLGLPPDLSAGPAAREIRQRAGRALRKSRVDSG